MVEDKTKINNHKGSSKRFDRCPLDTYFEYNMTTKNVNANNYKDELNSFAKEEIDNKNG